MPQAERDGDVAERGRARSVGGDPVAIGFDVAETDGNGQITSMIGFLDKAPAQAA